MIVNYGSNGPVCRIALPQREQPIGRQASTDAEINRQLHEVLDERRKLGGKALPPPATAEYTAAEVEGELLDDYHVHDWVNLCFRSYCGPTGAEMFATSLLPPQIIVQSPPRW